MDTDVLIVGAGPTGPMLANQLAFLTVSRTGILAIGESAQAIEAAGCGDLLRTHVVADVPGNAKELARVHITAPAFYLLRPGAQDTAVTTQWTIFAH